MTSKDIKRLFLAHQRELYAYLARKVRDGETAADLTQETFLRFAEQLRANPAAIIRHERSYLYRTAHNLAIDHIRQQLRERTESVSHEALAEIADDNPVQERIVNGSDELDLVRNALLELPERTRQVFALVRLEGLTYHDVARRLDISDSSVQKHLAKAIQHVMQCLRAERNMP